MRVVTACPWAQARAFLVKELQGWKPECFTDAGTTTAAASAIGLLSRQDLAHSAQLASVLECKQLQSLAAHLLEV